MRQACAGCLTGLARTEERHRPLGRLCYVCFAFLPNPVIIIQGSLTRPAPRKQGARLEARRRQESTLEDAHDLFGKAAPIPVPWNRRLCFPDKKI